MFKAKQALFHYTVSPVHMGAGTALGLIDNPIQREVHNRYPVFAGSGIKGALRHHLSNGVLSSGDITVMFGPESSGSSEQGHAGAVAFSDAQLVAFPVRCGRSSYAYAVSQNSLARCQRVLEIVEIKPEWDLKSLTCEDTTCLVSSDSLLIGQQVLLDSYHFNAQSNSILSEVAQWLSQHALPDTSSHQFFRNKLAKDLILLPDIAFNHFVNQATVVEAHVRINNVTGTAEDGGLFYSESLPPESLLISTMMSSQARKKGCDQSAEELLAQLSVLLQDQTVQFGGDATTGRGLVHLHQPVQEG